MWNSFRTDVYDGMTAEVITLAAEQNDSIHAYLAKPLGQGPYPAVVLIPHMPGWDEFYRETARRFAQHGFIAVCPDIYSRFGYGTPTEVANLAKQAGGVSDQSVMNDCRQSIKFLKNLNNTNQKIGIIGTCSGGRHAYLAACTLEGIDAAVDCWGGRVTAEPDELTAAQPKAPIDYTEQLNCPLLGIFGNDDHSPSAKQVDQLEATLKKYHKSYQFYRYDNAGHGFWYYHTDLYRPQQAMDSWEKVLTFFHEQLRNNT